MNDDRDVTLRVWQVQTETAAGYERAQAITGALVLIAEAALTVAAAGTALGRGPVDVPSLAAPLLLLIAAGAGYAGVTFLGRRADTCRQVAAVAMFDLGHEDLGPSSQPSHTSA